MTTPADVIFTNGAVFDGTRLLAEGTDVAVSGSTISAVGPGLRSAATGGERIVDVRGGLLLPGFIDAHIHPVEGGLERMRCDLSSAHTREGYLDLISRYAQEHPDIPWILGGGWQVSAFPGGAPLASDLDAIVPDRPVFVSSRDHHAAWANGVAFALAGITASTPDPVDGRIERDSVGAPAGVLQEGARLLISGFIPDDTPAENRAALLAAQSYLHSLGITGWQDAIVGDYGNHSDTGDIYLQAAVSGELTADVRAALWWDRTRGAEQIPGLVARRDALAHPRFSASTVKIMQDGIPENRTAAMTTPYLDPTCRCNTDSGGERGISFVDPIALADYVTELDALGFQVHMHAIGDRAVTESLDAIEAARDRNGPSGNRHHIAHVQIVRPDDVPRFAALDVTVNMQTLWATFEPQMVEFNVPLLGEERAAWQYPFGDFARSGARLAAGSDWPVTTPDPWAALQVAVTRTHGVDDPDFNPEPFYPAQALDLETALAAYTSGSARVNHQDSAGRITVGGDADLVVTHSNPFDAPSEEIFRTRTRQTWARGRLVFGAF